MVELQFNKSKNEQSPLVTKVMSLSQREENKLNAINIAYRDNVNSQSDLLHSGHGDKEKAVQDTPAVRSNASVRKEAAHPAIIA